MISVRCEACGSDLADTDDELCIHCGAQVSGLEGAPASPEPERATKRDPGDYGPLLVVAAFLVSVVAVGAITATLLSAVLRSGDGDAVAGRSSTVTSTTATTADPRPNTPSFDPPLSEAVTIPDPTLGEVARYHLGEDVVTFEIIGDFCGRGEGTIGAGGVLQNFSMAQQTLDYVIAVDLIRVWNRAPLGRLEATVEGLAPFESAPWSVEMVSSRVSTITCEITSVTLTPAGS